MPLISEQICTTRNIELARHIILNADTFAICGHINPDGDSIGSMLSLGLGLENIGKQVYMLCNDDLPRNYQFLPGATRLIKTLHRQVDVAISVDCGSKEMTGKNVEAFERARWVIEIDHHRSRTPFGDVLIVDADAACAGELVYDLLLELDVPITSEIAQNILTSLLVETNSFRLPGIRPVPSSFVQNSLKAVSIFTSWQNPFIGSLPKRRPFSQVSAYPDAAFPLQVKLHGQFFPEQISKSRCIRFRCRFCF